MKLPIAAAMLVVTMAVSRACAAEEPGFKVEAEARTALEHLSGGRADWRNTQLDLQARNAARQSYYGSLRTTERFDQGDGEVQMGTYQPFGGAWAVQIEAAASPTHRILARHSQLAQLERRFDGGWGVQAGYRRSAYERIGTDLGIISVDRYFSNFRAAYSLYLGRPDGAGFGPSHRLQWSYYYADRSSIGISAANGREAENVFPSGVMTSQVRSAAIAGRHEFARSWAITYEWLAHRQGDLYTRRGLGLGLRHAF